MLDKLDAGDIVEVAVKFEEAGKAFYTRVAEMASETRSFFEDLAKAEARHAELYRKLDPKKAFTKDDRATDYLANLMQTGPLASLTESGQLGQAPLNLDEAFTIAIQFEKDSVLFYSGLQSLLSASAAETNDKVVAQEKEHLRTLVATRRKLQGKR